MPIYAEESEQVKRARRKLKKKLAEVDNLVTPEALSRMSEEIHLWISKHIKDRIDLKDKNISLFDENQNVAKVTNRYIQKLKETLQDQISLDRENAQEKKKDLKGRVSSN
jgi:arylamine N-acetyltransferase